MLHLSTIFCASLSYINDAKYRHIISRVAIVSLLERERRRPLVPTICVRGVS